MSHFGSPMSHSVVSGTQMPVLTPPMSHRATSMAQSWGPSAEPSLLALRGIRLIEGEHGAGGTGGDPDSEDELETDAVDVDVDTDPDGAEQLGDPGKKALAEMKAKLKDERAKRRAAEAALAAKNATPPDGEPDADLIRAEADRAATARANTRILRSEIRAAAAGRLSDPADALRFVDLEHFEADDDGAFDQDEIHDAIDDLLETRPYLAAAQGQRRHGDGGGGPRGHAKPKQHTRDDLDRMTPAQVLAAHQAGELDHLLGKS